jgi:hypothetical protein
MGWLPSLESLTEVRGVRGSASHRLSASVFSDMNMFLMSSSSSASVEVDGVLEVEQVGAPNASCSPNSKLSSATFWSKV